MPVKAGPLTSHIRVSSPGSSDWASNARVTPSPKPAQPASSHERASSARGDLVLILRPVLPLGSSVREVLSTMRAALRSVAAREDEGPYRQQDRLEPQNRRVHDPDRVDHVQADSCERAEIGRLQLVVIAGIGVDDAAAAGCQGVEAALEVRLEIGGERTGA